MASIKDNTLTSVKEGSIVNFKAIAQTPLKSLRVNFTPIQQGEGDPSPENIRAISGWTGLSVYKFGKNMLNKNANWDTTTARNYRYYDSGIKSKCVFKFTLKDSTIDVSNIAIGVSLYEPKTVSEINKGYNWVFQKESIKSKNTNEISESTLTPSTKGQIGQWIVIYPNTQTAYDNLFAAYDIQITPYGMENDNYEPYNGTTIPVSWSDLGTVYGGYIDIISGEIWATWVCEEANNNNWNVTGGNAFQWGHSKGDITGSMYKMHICSHFKNTGYANEKFAILNGNGAMYLGRNFWLATGMTLEEITPESVTEYISAQKNAGTPVQICSPLLTPFLVGNITSQEVKTLIGTNNIYSDADSVSIEYYNLESLNLYKQRFKANQPYLETVSGSVASFQTALKAPLKECKVYFEPVQEGSGDPSPENIRPISGWTGLDIVRSNENLLPTDAIYCGKLIADGEEGTLRNSVFHTYCIPAPQGIFYMSKSSNGIVQLCLTDEIPQAGVQFWDGKSYTYYRNREMYNEAGHRYLAIMAGNTDEYDSYEKAFSSREVRMSMEANAPYVTPVGTTYPITFPISAGTVYGGYVDPVRGKIVAKYISILADGVNIKANTAYVKNDYYGAGIVYFSPRGKASHYYWQSPNVWCDTLPIYANDYSFIPGLDVPKAGALYCVFYIAKVEDHPELEDKTARIAYVNNWLQEHPTQIVYELETPVEYDLNSITIKTLKGTNNIWSNTNGNIQTKYWTYGNV